MDLARFKYFSGILEKQRTPRTILTQPEIA
jgi:hypothetical protein